jgi:hypothetical protein
MKLFGTYEYNQELADSMAEALNSAYSDKASMHNYHTVYASVLDGKTINNFLEVGLFLNELQHTDLNAWAAVFPDAAIYGADKKADQLFDSGNIKTTFVDQDDPASLSALKSTFDVEFDVILDDASHVFEKTIATLEALFNKVSTGGVYMIEDVIDAGEGGNDWQQTLVQLEGYLTGGGYNYEVFQSNEPRMVIDQETGEPTETPEASDDYIVCVYK